MGPVGVRHPQQLTQGVRWCALLRQGDRVPRARLDFERIEHLAELELHLLTEVALQGGEDARQPLVSPGKRVGSLTRQKLSSVACVLQLLTAVAACWSSSPWLVCLRTSCLRGC